MFSKLIIQYLYNHCKHGTVTK